MGAVLSTVRKEQIHFIFWLGPGLVLTILFSSWLPWTAAMSWWALVYTARCAVIAARAEEAARNARG